MMYRVRHSTVYTYDETVPVCQNEAHLKPRQCRDTKMLEQQPAYRPASRARPRSATTTSAIM